MPSWSIHCAVAKKIISHLDVDENTFLFGNIVADVDDDINHYGSYATHFYGTLASSFCPNEELPNIHEFYDIYKSKLNDPLIMGYYCHLLTDYYFNDYTYTNHWLMDENKNIIGVKLTNGEEKKTRSIYRLQEIKRKDFAKFGKMLYDKGLVDFPEYSANLINHAKLLEPNFINKNDIKVMLSKIYAYLDEVSKNNHQYTILNEEELFKVMENTSDNILERFKELGLTKGNKR